jgi:hypothetical protein
VRGQRDRPKGFKLHNLLLRKDGWKTFLQRGNVVFLAFGSLYVRSERTTQHLLTAVQSGLPGAPKGVGFVRLGFPGKVPVRAVLISGVGRFGNSIAQVLNSVSIANLIGAQEVLFHKFEAIRNREIDPGSGPKLRPMLLSPRNFARSPDVIWRTYAITPEILFCDPHSALLGPWRRALKAAVRYSIGGKAGREPNTLTIYLRGGDVFSPKPERYYGQPPWVFYKRILESRTWHRVRLVSEDERNPIHARVTLWCKEKDLPVERGGTSMDEAVRLVSQATNLVSARGTFVPSIVYLADVRQTVFLFHEPPVDFLQKGKTKVIIVKDVLGDYANEVMSANWICSESQLEMMLNSPEEAVSGLIDVDIK